MEYAMYVHNLIYGVPMGPVLSEEAILQSRWDIYRGQWLRDFHAKVCQSFAQEFLLYNPNENVHAEYLRG